MNKRQQGKWVGQYLVAGELTRRGYEVAIVQGNFDDDILIKGKDGIQFSVDVKCLAAGKTPWAPIRKRKSEDNLFYILVWAPPMPSYPQPKYYVLTSKEVEQITDKGCELGLAKLSEEKKKELLAKYGGDLEKQPFHRGLSVNGRSNLGTGVLPEGGWGKLPPP